MDQSLAYQSLTPRLGDGHKAQISLNGLNTPAWLQSTQLMPSFQEDGNQIHEDGNQRPNSWTGCSFSTQRIAH